MTLVEVITFTAMFAFAVIVLPLLFIRLENNANKIFDKSEIEYRDGDNT